MMAFTASRASCKVNCSNLIVFLVTDQAVVLGLVGPCSLPLPCNPSYSRVSQAPTLCPQHISTAIFNKGGCHTFSFGLCLAVMAA